MNTPFRLPGWPSRADQDDCLSALQAMPGPACPGPSAGVRPCAGMGSRLASALRSKLGGRPLPAAGGQPRRCTGARPNSFLAVGSRNSSQNHLEEPSIVDRDAFKCFRRAIEALPAKRSKSDAGRSERSEVASRSGAVLEYGEHRKRKIGSRSSPGPIYLSSALAPASSSFFLPASPSVLFIVSLTGF